MTHKGPNSQKFVWVTRPRPQADDHASAIAKADLTPLLCPVMNIRALPAPNTPPVAPSDAAGLIFTSINGLQNFPGTWLRDFLNHPVFVSGTTTRDLARDMGFQNIISSPDQGSHGMVGLIRKALPVSENPLPPKLLYVAGTSRTPLLEEELSPDFQLTLTELYAAELQQTLSVAAAQALENKQIVATTLFSSRTAIHAATLLQNHFGARAKPILDDLLAVCISQTVAERARESGFRNIAVASMETSESVVDKLVEQLKIHSISAKTN